MVEDFIAAVDEESVDGEIKVDCADQPAPNTSLTYGWSNHKTVSHPNICFYLDPVLFIQFIDQSVLFTFHTTIIEGM